jgi:hypothetical protein
MKRTKTGKPNNLIVPGSKRSKGHKQESEIIQ